MMSLWWQVPLMVGTVCVAVGAAVVGVARLIVSSMAHNQATCQCHACYQRRAIAVEKRKEEGRRTAAYFMDQDETYLPTTRLTENMPVSVNGQEYVIQRVERSVSGYLVQMKSRKDSKKTIITVPKASVNKRYWRPVRHSDQDWGYKG